MTNRITAIMIGAEPISVATPPLEIASTWAPAVYTLPPVPVPSEIVVSPVGDGAAVQFKLPAKGLQTVVETAPDVSGAPGAWKLLAQTSGIGVTVPLVAGERKWIRLKNVKNGRPSAYTAAQLVGGIRTPEAVPIGSNTLGNAAFTEASATVIGTVVSADTRLCDNWSTSLAGGTFWQAVHEARGTVLLRLRNDVSLPGGGGAYQSGRIISGRFDVLPGRVYRIYATGSNATTATPPAGFDMLQRVEVNWYTVAGAFISGSVLPLVNTYGASLLWSVLFNSPSNAARAEFVLGGYVRNTSGSTISAGGQTWASMRWTAVAMTLVQEMDADVAHGTTYGRIANSDLVDSAGVRRLGMRVPGSGHKPADQRNQHPVTVGSVRSRWDGLTISYSVPTTGSPATVTISTTAATLRLGSASVSYSAASSVVSQARGTSQTYQLYYTDASYAGGSRTLNITASTNDLANSDSVVWVGEVFVTVPTLGTAASGSGSNGGGSGGILP